MIEKNVFTYWETPAGKTIPPFIQYCLRSFLRLGKDINLIMLTPDNLHLYTKDIYMPPGWDRLKDISQKADIIRLAMLYQYGGAWVDADTVILKSFDHLFNEHDINLLRWKATGALLNGYIIAKQGSPFVWDVLQALTAILRDDFQEVYSDGCYIGQSRFYRPAQMFPVNVLPLETFIPIELAFNAECWYKEDDVKHYLTPDTVAVALNLSQYNDDFRKKSVEEHLASNNLFGSILRYSESLGSIL